jgi:hypothetical protein
MISIEKTLEPLRPYVIGIRYIEGLPVVDAIIKETWSVPEVVGIKRMKGKDEPNYSMIFTEDTTLSIDDILNYVASIIKVNLEMEAKNDLLKSKIEELKQFFMQHSLDSLQHLNFVIDRADVTSNLSPIQEISLIDSLPIPTEEDMEAYEEEKRADEFRKMQLQKRKKEEVIKLTAPVLNDFPTQENNKSCSCKEGEACSICIDDY